MTGALIDANLLCLLVVGRVDQTAISSHPRLKAFESDDFEDLIIIIGKLGDPVFCPHVLAETSNLLAYRQSSLQIERWLGSLAELVEIYEERTEGATIAIRDRAYRRLGLTDAMLMTLAADRSLALVSDDLRLCDEAQRRGMRTINYNHVRDGALSIAQL